MNVRRLKEIIANRDCDIADITSYLSDNYRKISNSSREFSNKETRTEIICKVFTYLSKNDEDIRNYLNGFPGKTLKEKLFVAVTNQSSTCPLGNERPYVDRLYRYGMCRSFCECQVKKKIETMTDRYGVSNPMHVEDVKKKLVAANTERFGGASPFNSNAVQEKARSTLLDRYGVDNVFKSANHQEQIKRTLVDRYGVSNPTLNPDIRKRQIETNFARYGDVNFMKSKHSPLALEVLDNPVKLEQQIRQSGIRALADELNIHTTTIYNYVKRHDLDLGKGSSYEHELIHFLADHDIKCIHGDRTSIAPLELDVLIPDFNLAIEINGLYWHSDAHKSKDYHVEKLNKCTEAGLRLVSVFEDEWLERSDLIKAKILNLCGQSIRGCGARKLQIARIPNKDAHEFVQQHHIQGRTGYSTSSYGAFHNGRLVAAMQFNKQRSSMDIELIRYCTDGKVYPGIFSRLLKHAITSEHMTKVVSFADRRFSEGDVYARNGFTLQTVTKPDYRYVKRTQTYHKSNFTKKRIQEKFGLDMTAITESQAMRELGYLRIYDCGKLKYIWLR